MEIDGTGSPDECKRMLHPDSLAVRIRNRAPWLRDISLELWVAEKKVGMFHKGDQIPQYPEGWPW